MLKNVTEIRNMIGHTDFFDLIDRCSKGKANNKRTNCILLIILYLNAFFGNIHPSAILACKVKHIEIFKSIEFELSVFGR